MNENQGIQANSVIVSERSKGVLSSKLAAGVVEFAESAVDEIVAEEGVAVAVVAVLEAVGGCAGAGLDPALIVDSGRNDPSRCIGQRRRCFRRIA
jgi:hypothetical protein